LSGLHDVFAIADDLLVSVSGVTMADAERDHAHNLQQLKERCKVKSCLRCKYSAVKHISIDKA